MPQWYSFNPVWLTYKLIEEVVHCTWTWTYTLRLPTTRDDTQSTWTPYSNLSIFNFYDSSSVKSSSIRFPVFDRNICAVVQAFVEMETDRPVQEMRCCDVDGESLWKDPAKRLSISTEN